MDEIKGSYEVAFMNGDIRFINVKQNIVNHLGQPLYLEDVTGRLFNWQNIMVIRKEGGGAGPINGR